MAIASRRTDRADGEPRIPSGGKKSGGGPGLKMPDLEKRAGFLFAALPPLTAIFASLGYLKGERWQEALQWGVMGVGLGLRAVPEDALPFGDRLKKMALIFLAAGGALFGYWIFDQWTG